MRYFFRVEYDGTRYGGWQRQHNAVSIQEMLEKAFATVVRRPCAVTGAGRTDAGVHARAQGAHIDIDIAGEVRTWELSVNALLPPDIAIYNMQPVGPEFHARFSARSRHYRYVMCGRKRPMLFKRVWMVFYRVDWDLAAANCAALLGRRDFAVFCASGSGSDSTECTVHEAKIDKEGDLIVFSICANRFIYKMVRSVVGTLVEIGRGASTMDMASIIASGDRTLAGPTAPACGLVLDHVDYAEVT